LRTNVKQNITIRLLRVLLFPFSVIFFLIVWLKNFLYDKGVLNSVNIGIPVISIGNISTGGTGKTPFLIFIAEYFLRKGKNIGIISRGYGRESKGLILVSDGINIFKSPKESGDEVYMIAYKLIKHFNNFTVVSSEDRVKASYYLIHNHNCDLILLDDAFQNRHIFRNLDIVLIDGKKLRNFTERILLPGGNLREPFSSLERSDVIIFNNKFNSYNNYIEIFNKYNKPFLISRYSSENFYNIRDEILNVKDAIVILFCGIAEPHSFFEVVNKIGLNISNTIIFKDHINYDISDLNEIANLYSEEKVFITTEKDFIKILQFKEFIEKYPVYYLKMNIEIESNEIMLNKRLETLIN